MSQNTLYGRDVISLGDYTLEEITLILDRAEDIKAKARPDYLKHKLLASCFFEPSTRTKLSFESAMMRLGGDVIGFSDAKSTSSKKGESLQDSMRVIAAYCDAIVLRHPLEGAARLAAEVSNKPVINAGDGANRHPSQTLLDLFTIRECQGKLDGLQIAFVGDLKYGRTVHSLTQVFRFFPKTRFYFVSPEILRMPDHVCAFLRSAGIRFSFHEHLTEVFDKCDVVYMTRLQKERLDETEFQKIKNQFSLTTDLLDKAKPNCRILHPLPRVDEIDVGIDKTPYAYYFEQAENGLYARQALLSLLLAKD